ncbi:MAG: hypothetical protein RL138_1084 [Bacteroidota bacterium]
MGKCGNPVETAYFCDMTESAPLVAVVLLNWNGQHWLERFLGSVLQTNYPNLKVVLGDNASTDHSVSWTRTHFPNVAIIQNDKNYGFAGGYNRILEHVKADYYVLLNTDVEVPANWLQPMIELIESKPSIAAVQPRFVLQTDKNYLEYSGAAGGFTDAMGYMFCQGRIFDSLEKNEGQFAVSKPIFWACGACLLVRADAFWQVHGFDDDFFAHQEEIDLCWRLQNSGYEIYYCAESEVYHVGGGMLPASSPFKTYLNFRNSLYLLFKNWPLKTLLIRLLPRLVLDGVAGLKFIKEGKFKETWAIVKAHWHFFAKLPQLLRKRRYIHHPADMHELKGYYPKSILWQYFVRGKKRFKDLY